MAPVKRPSVNRTNDGISNPDLEVRIFLGAFRMDTSK